MDILRLTPKPNLLIVSKTAEGETEEPRELMRIPIQNAEEAREQIHKLVSWAINMQVPIEIPMPEKVEGESQ